jgi:uncharacterized protein YdeI (YjbR/CyaY-like superfamily)
MLSAAILARLNKAISGRWESVNAVPPLFFPAPSDFRSWLRMNHKQKSELWVGFYRKGSGQPSITWPEAVDEALCVGWIDGLRKTIDAKSYKIRFTPRKTTSNWSAINIGRVQELTKQDRMCPAGLKAFKLRKEEKSGIYSYENRKSAVLGGVAQERFRSRRKAWRFFQSQSTSYRQTLIWWVVSAKREETRKQRLEKLIAQSEEGKRMM